MSDRFTNRNPDRPGFWYLATPYSNYPIGIEAAFKLACWQSGALIRAGVPVFSPIAHSHPIAMACRMDPLDHDIWLPLDMPMMDAARGLIVCMAEGWDTSYGVRVETETFRKAGKQIVYMRLGEVPAELIAPRAITAVIAPR